MNAKEILSLIKSDLKLLTFKEAMQIAGKVLLGMLFAAAIYFCMVLAHLQYVEHLNK